MLLFVFTDGCKQNRIVLCFFFFFFLSGLIFKKFTKIFVLFSVLFLGFNLVGFSLLKNNDSRLVVDRFAKQDRIYVEGVFKKRIFSSKGKSRIQINIKKLVDETGQEVSGIKHKVFVDLKTDANDLDFWDTVCLSGDLHRGERQDGYKFYYIDDVGVYKKITPKYLSVVNKARRGLFNLIDKNDNVYGRKGSAILKALVLGDKSYIDYDIKQSFINSGTYHVFAISGLHIGIIYVLLLYLFQALRLSNKIIDISIVSLLALYSVLTGLSPPVVRAVFMLGLYMFAGHWGREKDGFNILAIAAFFILLIRPDQLFDVSFQLTFVAVISILLSLKFSERVSILNDILKGLIVSCFVFVFMLPISSYYFGKIIPFMPLTNLLIVPLMSTLIFLAFVSFALSPIVFLSAYVSKFVWLIVNYMLFVTDKVDGLKVVEYRMPVFFVFVCYICLLVGVWVCNKMLETRNK